MSQIQMQPRPLRALYTLAFIFALLLATPAIAQTNTTAAASDDKLYTEIEAKPEFPGGMANFYKYISKKFKLPKRFKGSGKLIVQFVVEKDGSISDIKVLRDLEPGFTKEITRLLKACPTWKPGRQNGQNVRVLYSLPINISR